MILIRKVKEQFGWLGNMAAFPVEHEGKVYRTTEALFHALRFSDETIIESIRREKSPMSSKMIAKKYRDHMVVEPMSLVDLDNMRMVLRLKVEQHPKLRDALLATSDEEIVEDCTRRSRGSGLFWGAAQKEGEWVGENWLGCLWMELRASLNSSESDLNGTTVTATSSSHSTMETHLKMITILKGQHIGISTKKDLSDKLLGRAWANLTFDISNRISIIPHPDGKDRWVFAANNIYVEFAPLDMSA